MKEVIVPESMRSTELLAAQEQIVYEAGARIRDLVQAEALPYVYRAYGLDMPASSTSIREQLNRVTASLGPVLGYRQGTPRSRQVPELSVDQTTVIQALGAEIGMTAANRPSDRTFDVAVVNGTFADGVWSRTELVAGYLQNQTTPKPGLTIIGASNGRKLSAEDRAGAYNQMTYAPDAHDETDLMDAAFQTQLGAVAGYGSRTDLPENVRQYRLPDGTAAYTVRAPKVEGGLEANTFDSLALIERITGRERLLGGLVLGTTISVYAPFQWFDMARRFYPYGARVELATAYDPSWTKPAHIAQEYKSALHQAARFLDAIPQLNARSI